jgi:hypothetical protein
VVVVSAIIWSPAVVAERRTQGQATDKSAGAEAAITAATPTAKATTSAAPAAKAASSATAAGKTTAAASAPAATATAAVVTLGRRVHCGRHGGDQAESRNGRRQKS